MVASGCVCGKAYAVSVIGDMLWDQPPDEFHEWVLNAWAYFVLLAVILTLEFGQKNVARLVAFYQTPYRIQPVAYEKQLGCFPNSEILLLLFSQMESFSEQSLVQDCVHTPLGCGYLSHFLLSADLSLKDITRGLFKVQQNPSPQALSLHPACRASYQQTLAALNCRWLQETRNIWFLWVYSVLVLTQGATSTWKCSSPLLSEASRL